MYLDKVFSIKFKSLQELNCKLKNPNGSRKYLIIAFRKFISYCYELDLISDEIDSIVKNKFKTSYKSNIDSYIPNKEDIDRSLSILESKEKYFFVLYKLLLYSGARFTEIKHMILSFDKSNIEEHEGRIVTYRNFYLRGNKSSFYIFFPKEIWLEVKDCIPLTHKNIEHFRDIIQEDKEIVNTKYLRKYQFTQLIKAGVDIETANYIQGRASQNIGFNHYLAKKEIAIEKYKLYYNFFR